MINLRTLSLRTRSLSEGITLLESMLVVVILLAVLLLSVQQYRAIVFEREAAEIQNSLRILNQALEQYYASNCYTFLKQYKSYPINPYSNTTPITSASLTLNQYVATPAIINNPFNPQVKGLSAYSYTINTSSDFPTIEISTTFPPSFSLNELTVLAGLLKPNVMNQKTKSLTWSTAPNNTQLTPAPATPALSYIDTLSMQLSSSSTAYTATCAYWQNPKNRCTITGANTGTNNRCDYQNKP